MQKQLITKTSSGDVDHQVDYKIKFLKNVIERYLPVTIELRVNKAIQESVLGIAQLS
ncbi:hypothetical protein [Wolbachia endosymbiont of Atemnus politus]|uniref:hypothetical protein n=1 Tax=Wolbachia endosymbiont of Atemnus politus TaxID=2682840 RepID=UPI001C551FC9|nr:hypothetical protein [Wolbachia endosymbiont of Atemnus politus]